MSHPFNPLDLVEQKYPVPLDWGMAEMMVSVLMLRTHLLLARASQPEHFQPISATEALAVRPLLQLAKRLRKRHWRELATTGRKRSLRWQCPVSFDELVAVVECCQPGEDDYHHGAYLRFHQKAVSLNQYIVIP